MVNDSKFLDDSEDEELPKYDQVKTHPCKMKEGETGRKSPPLGPPFGRSQQREMGVFLVAIPFWILGWG